MKRGIFFLTAIILMSTIFIYEAPAEKDSATKNVYPKIAYIDMGKVFLNYEKAKNAEETLRKESEDRQKDVEKKQAEITKLEKQFKDQESLLSEKNKKKRLQTIERKKTSLQELLRKYDGEMRSKFMKIQKEIIEEIDRKVEAFARENGYVLLLNAEQVFYGSKSLDVTEEVTTLLNKK